MKIDGADAKVAAGFDLDGAIAQRITAAAGFLIAEPAFADIRLARLSRDVNRTVYCSQDYPQAARMVAMLVRDEDRIESFRILAHDCQPARSFARAHAGIN